MAGLGVVDIVKKQTLLKSTNDRKLCKVMNNQVLKGHGIFKKIEKSL